MTTTTKAICKNCDEDIYLQAWMGEDGEEFDWCHEWSRDSLCDTDLRRIVSDDEDWPPLGATFAQPPPALDDEGARR